MQRASSDSARVTIASVSTIIQNVCNVPHLMRTELDGIYSDALAGEFSFQDLPFDLYTVSATSASFETLKVEKVQVSAGAPASCAVCFQPLPPIPSSSFRTQAGSGRIKQAQ